MKNTAYNHTTDCFYTKSDQKVIEAVRTLMADPSMNQYSPATAVDAAMQSDTNVQDVTTPIKAILSKNDHYGYEEILTFTCFVLFYYAKNTGKDLSDAYRDFITYDIFTVLRENYWAAHSYTLDHAGDFTKNVIDVRRNVREEYGFSDPLSAIDVQHISNMPAISADNGTVDVTRSFRKTANLVVITRGTTITTDVACLVIFKSIIEKRDVKSVIDELSLDDKKISKERERKAINIVKFFTKEHDSSNLPWKKWHWMASVCGLMPIIESVGEDGRVLSAINSETRKMQQKRSNR